MSSFKRFLCVLFSVMFLVCSLPLLSLAEEADVEEEEEEEIVYPDELIVGHPTITKGDFFTEMFGNDTADIDVRALVHGYNLVNWDQNQGVYVLDPTVVIDSLVTDDELGNRTYDLVLADDLYYSDGTPITAWDYAFSMLLMMAPEIEEIGGKIYRAEHLLGYDEYITGCRKIMAGTPWEELPLDEQVLSGVEVIDDHQIMITLDHDFLPYFFEVGLLLCVPYPIDVIAPGCKVYSGEYGGIYLGNADPNVKERVFTAELLEKTILDPETGYNSRPSKVCGPYTMVSYDGVTSHYQINEYFKGAWVNNSLPDEFHFNVEELIGAGSGSQVNRHDAPNYMPILDAGGEPMIEKYDEDGNPIYYWMVKPTIEKICFTLADNDTMAEDLATEKFHLVNKVTYGPTILECMGVSTSGTYVPEGGNEEEPLEAAAIRFTNYPRIGLAFLTFTYDWPTVHDKEVRQAIAWCMDREQLTQDYCSGFGVVVNGYYGMEQWEYLLVTGQLDFPVNMLDEVLPPVHEEDDEEKLLKYRNRYVRTQEEFDAAVAAWETLVKEWDDGEGNTLLTEYCVDLDKANAILDSAKWTLNRNGEKYQPGVDDVRCKEIDGELVALDLTMMYPEGNHMAEFMTEREDGEPSFLDNLAEVGIRVTLVPTPMEDLLHSYYRETERTTDMIYLATNFHVMVDPSITYSTDDTLNHQIWNNTYSDDEDLFYRAVNMRKTEPMDVFEYVSKWMSFQARYNEVLPTIPIYSNIYFDFWNAQLQNYYITGSVTWSQAILEAYFGDEREEEEEDEDEEDFGDDEMFFE